MKKIILSLLLLIIAYSIKAQATDTIYSQLALIKLNNFVDKPIDSFFAVLPLGYTSTFIPATKYNRVRSLAISYPGGSDFRIYVKTYQFMNPIDSNRIWDLTLFKKEKLFYVDLVHPDHNALTSRDYEIPAID